jgi:CRISPR-associated protein Cmr6
MPTQSLRGRRERLDSLRHATSTHPGLWLDKYLRVLSPQTEEDKNAIRDLLLDACSTDIPEGYLNAQKRRQEALQSLDGGVSGGTTLTGEAEARGRMVIGLGSQSLRETNIALLSSWGVPYLPGSALKGLAAATAHQLGGGPTWNKATEKMPQQGKDHRALFGDTTTAGWVVFHDAWWIPEPEGGKLPLDLDVMTVHHAGYYKDGGEAPADWDEPNPVGFLTAHGRYFVALSGPEEWAARAFEWLKIGMEQTGIGAKTQAGYGRMTLTRKPSQRELEKEQRDTEMRRRIDELQKLPVRHQGAQTARQHIGELISATAQGIPAPEVHKVAQALFAKDQSFWRKWAKDPRRTDAERAFLKESGMIP